MAKIRQAPGCCPKLRRWLQTSSNLNILTGDVSQEKQEWVEGPCNTPLFGAAREAGICASCAKGWSCDTNYPVEAK